MSNLNLLTTWDANIQIMCYELRDQQYCEFEFCPCDYYTDEWKKKSQLVFSLYKYYFYYNRSLFLALK